MSEDPVYDLHGLRARSSLELPHPREGPGAVVLELSLEESQTVGDAVPPGELLAELADGGEPIYIGVRTLSGYVLRCHGACDFLISADLATVRCVPCPDVTREFVAILANGTLTSFLLALRGHCILHAGAVEIGGSVLAFVGDSGMGKSTLTALSCAAGARLVSDDVLRVEFDERVVCFAGAKELRLRAAARDVLDRFPTTPPIRTTADDRIAVALSNDLPRRLPLGAIVIPSPSRSATRLTVERVRPAEGVARMAAYPRIWGWRDRDVLAREFRHLAELARRVPVYEAELPWGPPFADDLASQLIAAVDLAAHNP